MKDWQYHPASDIDLDVAEALRRFPREPHMLSYALRWVGALLLRAWMRIYHRFAVIGADNLPAEGSYILVCNHTSHLDTLSILASVPLSRVHRTFPAAAADYFFASLPRSLVSAVLINALPFDRKEGGSQSLELCRGLLASPGNTLVLFPEGTRTTSGQMGRFRSGVGRLVAGTDLKVVPCHLDGGLAAWPKGKILPRPRRLTLRIGEATEYSQVPDSRNGVQTICRDLEHRVALLGDPQK